jgi:four helix bundle protein
MVWFTAPHAMSIRRFEEIEGWRLARELTKAVYVATKGDRFSRDLGLKDQIQRAAGSVMHNVAEGFDSGSNAEFLRFLRYAQRSATEVLSQLYVALDQNYISEDQFLEITRLAAQSRSKIGGLIVYLKSAKRP